VRSQERRLEEGRLSFELTPTPNAVAQARDGIREAESLLDARLIDDVRLMTSELVTNSVRHGSLSEGARIDLGVLVTPTTVRVEVTDPGRGFGADAIGPTGDGQSGWGLFFVDRLADRWGVDCGEHTRVWFEIARGPLDSGATV